MRHEALTLQEAKEFKLLISGKMPEGWADALPTFTPEDKGLATRLHSQTMLNALSSVLPGAPGACCSCTWQQEQVQVQAGLLAAASTAAACPACLQPEAVPETLNPGCTVSSCWSVLLSCHLQCMEQRASAPAQASSAALLTWRPAT